MKAFCIIASAEHIEDTISLLKDLEKEKKVYLGALYCGYSEQSYIPAQFFVKYKKALSLTSCDTGIYYIDTSRNGYLKRIVSELFSPLAWPTVAVCFLDPSTLASTLEKLGIIKKDFNLPYLLEVSPLFTHIGVKDKTAEYFQE